MMGKNNVDKNTFSKLSFIYMWNKNNIMILDEHVTLVERETKLVTYKKTITKY